MPEIVIAEDERPLLRFDSLGHVRLPWLITEWRRLRVELAARTAERDALTKTLDGLRQRADIVSAATSVVGVSDHPNRAGLFKELCTFVDELRSGGLSGDRP